MGTKIVITHDEKGAFIGIQRPECDPIFSRVEGDLPAVLKRVPKLVQDAITTWAASPRYRKCETDLKPPTPPTPQVSTQRTRQTVTEQPQLI